MSGSRTSPAEFILSPHSPFADLPLLSGPGRAVIAADRDGLAIARLAARKGQLATLAARVRERFGIELPQAPRRVEANGLAFVAVGVETWLAVSDGGFAATRPVSGAADTRLTAATNNGFIAALRELTVDVAAVCDQTGGYAVLRLTGPRIRDALAKLIPLDLHDSVFNPGSAASTLASHVAVTLWRLADSPGGWPVFEIAAPRSYAGSFWHAVVESSAEFGFARE